jgi:hypothetical protein
MGDLSITNPVEIIRSLESVWETFSITNPVEIIRSLESVWET